MNDRPQFLHGVQLMLRQAQERTEIKAWRRIFREERGQVMDHECLRSCTDSSGRSGIVKETSS